MRSRIGRTQCIAQPVECHRLRPVFFGLNVSMIQVTPGMAAPLPRRRFDVPCFLERMRYRVLGSTLRYLGTRVPPTRGTCRLDAPTTRPIGRNLVLLGGVNDAVTLRSRAASLRFGWRKIDRRGMLRDVSSFTQLVDCATLCVMLCPTLLRLEQCREFHRFIALRIAVSFLIDGCVWTECSSVVTLGCNLPPVNHALDLDT